MKLRALPQQAGAVGGSQRSQLGALCKLGPGETPFTAPTSRNVTPRTYLYRHAGFRSAVSLGEHLSSEMRVSQVFGPFGGRFDPRPTQVLAGLRAARAAWLARKDPHPSDFIEDMQGLGNFSVSTRLRYGLVRLTDALNLVQWLASPVRRHGDVAELLDQALALYDLPAQRARVRRGGWRVSRSPLHLAPEVALRPLRPLELPSPATTPMPAELWQRPCPTCERPVLKNETCLHGRGTTVKRPSQRRKRRRAA